jgi:hypothetical protein
MNAQVQSKVISLDAPVEGWNAFHGLDDMPPTAAIVLDNLIPGTGSVKTREGHTEYVDLGTDAPVETVAGFSSSSSDKLIAASNGGIFDITDRQSVITLAAASTYLNDRWQTENFRTAGETGRLIMCNGDTTLVFDGSALTPLVDTDTVGIDFIGCVAFKGRMYYWKDNDNAFYYTNAGSYQGNMQKFDLGGFSKQGGKIVLIDTWTQQDSGDGKDDFMVILFDTGETLVYQGDDPDLFFEFVGRYYMAEPLSIRGSTGYGSDLIVLTRDGYVNLSSIIQQGRSSDVPQFSRLIHRAIKTRTDSNSKIFGWDVELFQKKGLMIFNVPVSTTSFEQHVLNTVTMRWCRFTGVQPVCLEVFNERLFGGTVDGRVIGILEGQSDNGSAITFTAQYAFNYLEAPGYQKQMVSAQILSTNQNPELIEITGYADFQLPSDGPLQLPDSGIYAVWDQTDWDTDLWAFVSDAQTTKGWHNAAAFGYAVSLRVRFALVEEGAEWRATGLRYFVAGAH